jgi:hypothetical protein
VHDGSTGDFTVGQCVAVVNVLGRLAGPSLEGAPGKAFATSQAKAQSPLRFHNSRNHAFKYALPGGVSG